MCVLSDLDTIYFNGLPELRLKRDRPKKFKLGWTLKVYSMKQYDEIKFP